MICYVAIENFASSLSCFSIFFPSHLSAETVSYLCVSSSTFAKDSALNSIHLNCLIYIVEKSIHIASFVFLKGAGYGLPGPMERAYHYYTGQGLRQYADSVAFTDFLTISLRSNSMAFLCSSTVFCIASTARWTLFKVLPMEATL